MSARALGALALGAAHLWLARRRPHPPRGGRGSSALTLVGVVALGVLFANGSPRAAEAKGPADFAMPRAESSPGQVTFSHDKHTAKVPKCTTCHMKHFRMKRGQSEKVTLEAKQAGKLCGACHDGKTAMGGRTVFAIDQCDSCHKD